MYVWVYILSSQNCFITPGWQLMRAGYRTCFHMLYDGIYIYKSKVKLATLVEGDLKAPFLRAITPRCREGTTSFPGLLHFTLDPHLIFLSVKQGGIKYRFWVFDMTRPGIEPRSPRPLVNTLTIIPIQLYGLLYV